MADFCCFWGVFLAFFRGFVDCNSFVFNYLVAWTPFSTGEGGGGSCFLANGLEPEDLGAILGAFSVPFLVRGPAVLKAIWAA